MLFANFLGVIQAIVDLNDNATAGQIQRMNPHMTKRQVETYLKNLEREGYLHNKIEPHGSTGKRVYYLSGKAVYDIQIVTKHIDFAGYQA